MTLDINRVRPRRDCILVLMDIHDPDDEEEMSDGKHGAPILIPRMHSTDAKAQGAIYATIVAVGPGAWHDVWGGHELGTTPFASGPWVPMNPELKPGVRVMLDHTNTGNRVYGDDRTEYRMVVEYNCVAIVEDEDEREVAAE
jgi:hypothetical protein